MAVNLKEGDRVSDRVKKGTMGVVMWVLRGKFEVCWVRWDYDLNYQELRGFEELKLIYENE